MKFLYEQFPKTAILLMSAITVLMIGLCISTYTKGQFFHTVAWVILSIDYLTRIWEFVKDYLKTKK